MEIEFEESKDEQIVNEALLQLLNLTVHLPNVHSAWSPFRSPFNKATFGDKVTTALTDGCLETDSFSEMFAITEVKPTGRRGSCGNSFGLSGGKQQRWWPGSAMITRTAELGKFVKDRLSKAYILTKYRDKIIVSLGDKQNGYLGLCYGLVAYCCISSNKSFLSLSASLFQFYWV